MYLAIHTARYIDSFMSSYQLKEANKTFCQPNYLLLMLPLYLNELRLHSNVGVGLLEPPSP